MKKLYAVYDIKAETTAGPLWQFQADAAAVRVFQDLLRDNQNELGKHPEDYELRYYGYFDDANDTIVASLGGEVIITGAAWLATQEKSTGA